MGGSDSHMFAVRLVCRPLATMFALDSFTRREGHGVTATTGASLVGVVVVVPTGGRDGTVNNLLSLFIYLELVYQTRPSLTLRDGLT